MNNAKTVHAKSFWKTLKLQEARIRSHFKRYSLVVAQASTKERAMSAASLQVQLCEYRQFRRLRSLLLSVLSCSQVLVFAFDSLPSLRLQAFAR